MSHTGAEEVGGESRSYWCPGPMSDQCPIGWLDWSDEAFARAAAADKPILLSIVATWCPACAEMERLTYADGRVAAAVARLVIPIRVDADRRPDVAERYLLGGWPTTAFLTPAGDLLGGGTYVPPDRLAAALEQVAALWRSRRVELEARARAARAARATTQRGGACEPDANAVEWALAYLSEQFDHVYGGFGQAPKEPHPDALAFLLTAHRREPTERVERMLRGTLDAVVGRGLHDTVEGGFFRACAARDWTEPHTAKLLELNAALLAVLVDAWETLGLATCRDAAVGLVRYVQSTLTAREGGFFASQRADDDYYGRSTLAARRLSRAPAVDTTLYADRNGWMAWAALRAARVLDDPSAAAAVIEGLERVLAAAYRRGAGLAHWVGASDDAPQGLLADQVWASAALLEAYEASGRPVYLDLAAELMLYCRRHLWDEDAGGFYDRPVGTADPGLLAEPVKPLAANCEAACVLARLATLTGRDDLWQDARKILAALAPTYREYGVAGAAYARASLEVIDRGGSL